MTPTPKWAFLIIIFHLGPQKAQTCLLHSARYNQLIFKGSAALNSFNTIYQFKFEVFSETHAKVFSVRACKIVKSCF